MRAAMVMLGVVVGVVLAAGPVAAGGWAMTTVVEMPQTFLRGEAHDVVFEIRQHGTHLVTDLDDVGVSLTSLERPGESLFFAAHAAGTQWRAVVVTPKQGTWTWAIHPGWFEKVEMGALSVAEAPSVRSTGTFPGDRVLAGAVLALVGVGLLLTRRRESVPLSA